MISQLQIPTTIHVMEAINWLELHLILVSLALTFGGAGKIGTQN